MYSVIRIPTKFCKSIKRLSDKDKLFLLESLIKIGEGEKISCPDSHVGDTLSLIVTEWMNMESRNGVEKYIFASSICSESLGTETPSHSEPIVKYNIVKDSKIKDNIISSKEEITQALVVSDKRDGNIDELIETIKQTLEPLGLIYKAGKQERNRAKNILTAKDFGETCNKAGMTRKQFVVNIIKISAKLDFWNGKIYNCETFYEHYPKVYNEARRIKTEKETIKSSHHII